MSSPPNNSYEIMDSTTNIFWEESSDEEIEYTSHTYTRVAPIKNNSDVTTLSVRLPQRHSLWAHLAWNAGIALSDFLDKEIDFTNKTVLELGSGAGLPCFIAALNNAKRVVMTDYPEDTLINNMKYNRSNTVPERVCDENNRLLAVPHLWGKNPEELNQLLDEPSKKFDIIILSDLLFNHAVHDKMLETCSTCLSDNGIIYVSFSHHRPHRQDKDLYFFELAKDPEFNFESEKFKELKMQAMFENDLGCEETRSTVHFYTMKRKISTPQ
ncbi:putative methyltransferase [Cavenderia fasciculata]|uniref:Methyltransferase n=1 Tax=Cavenderia fasciculata TaxID=261658 RepID=F4PS79_CACFS|nr:putative methyltransferase [Cavenderia fasciculata]EGG21462.1 putative methyltransferase [Cavenderia fasciculata]|eukprot:XP_004359312.1 putative methyltransferase [Cavenderia fasciculata]